MWFLFYKVGMDVVFPFLEMPSLVLTAAVVFNIKCIQINEGIFTMKYGSRKLQG